MIPFNSRYAQGFQSRLADYMGTYQLAVLRTVPPILVQFHLYLWGAQDRPDTVAFDALGDSQLWWWIFDINPEVIDPFNVPPGTVVRIPNGPPSGQGTLLQ